MEAKRAAAAAFAMFSSLFVCLDKANNELSAAPLCYGGSWWLLESFINHDDQFHCSLTDSEEFQSLRNLSTFRHSL